MPLNTRKKQKSKSEISKWWKYIVANLLIAAVVLTGVYFLLKQDDWVDTCTTDVCEYEWITIHQAQDFSPQQREVIVSQLNTYKDRFGCFQDSIKIFFVHRDPNEEQDAESIWSPAVSTAGEINVDPRTSLKTFRYIVSHEAGHACRSNTVIELDEPVINEYGEIYAVDGFSLLVRVIPKGIKKYGMIEEAFVDRNASCIPGYDLEVSYYWPATVKFLQWFPCDDMDREKILMEWFKQSNIWSIVEEFREENLGEVTVDEAMRTMSWFQKELP